MTFPFYRETSALDYRDFSRFELHFIQVALDLFPCSKVHFVPIVSDAERQQNGKSRYANPETWSAGAALVRKEGRPVVDSEAGIMFLPVYGDECIAAAAVLQGGPDDFYRKSSTEWLAERCRLMSKQFIHLKRWAQDPESGLLNAGNFFEHLRLRLKILSRKGEDRWGTVSREDGHWSVMLIDLRLGARQTVDMIRGIGRAGAFLDSYLGEVAPVYHLGSGIFALLWQSENDDELQKISYALLRRLKRHNQGVAHIGIKKIVAGDISSFRDTGTQPENSVLDQAWAALEKARRRGPFALGMDREDEFEQMLKATCPPEAVAFFTKHWRGQHTFSVILLQKDVKQQSSGRFSQKVCSLIGEEAAFFALNANEAFLFLGGQNARKAASWAKKLVTRIEGLQQGTYSMGIASHPCLRYKKSDTLPNSRKAIMHGHFFGPATIQVFDAVSLNISGDAFFNNGDLYGAIREYRTGLQLAPKNSNLLNSLGVVYALMNQYKRAVPLFEAATHRRQDFMALYNLGSAYVRLGMADAALKTFEKAYRHDEDYFDLNFQLGQLYCQNRKYKKAVELLEKAEKAGGILHPSQEMRPWERARTHPEDRENLGKGMVYRHLAEAYHGLKLKKKAMTALERAIGYNPRDAWSLSLLGALYASQNQGDEIALSLCRQAAEIEEKEWRHWQRLAEIHRKMNNLTPAEEAIEQALARCGKNLEMFSCAAKFYEEMKNGPKMIKMYKKLLSIDKNNKRALKILAKHKGRR